MSDILLFYYFADLIYNISVPVMTTKYADINRNHDTTKSRPVDCSSQPSLHFL